MNKNRRFGMKEFDVLVVGAGPAGSTVAQVAAEKGLEVLLVDKLKSGAPRKACGGILPDCYAKEIPKELVDGKLRGGSYHSPSGYLAEIEFPVPLSIIAREKLDLHMARKAAENGAVFKQGTVAERFVKRGDKIKTRLKSGGKTKTVQCKVLVGADGVPSTVARSFGLVSAPSPGDYVCCHEYFVDVSAGSIEGISSDFFEMFYSTKYSNGFYAWLEPAGDYVIVGTGCTGGQASAKTSLNEFVRKGPIASKKCLRKIAQEKAGVMWLGQPKRTYAERVILVGDAAGMASPFSGEGIYYAITAGKIAGDLLAEALSDENEKIMYYLKLYEQQWKKKFYWEHERNALLQRYFMKNDRRLDFWVKALKHKTLNNYMAAHLSRVRPTSLFEEFKILLKILLTVY